MATDMHLCLSYLLTHPSRSECCSGILLSLLLSQVSGLLSHRSGDSTENNRLLVTSWGLEGVQYHILSSREGQDDKKGFRWVWG